MPNTPKAKVLLVEDEAGFRRIYRDMLEHAGYAVLEAEDGTEGLSLAMVEKPDLIMLDLILPKLHGLEVLKQLRANQDTAKLPVVILSVLGDQQDVREGLSYGATGYVVKGSTSVDEVLEEVETLLHKSRK